LAQTIDGAFLEGMLKRVEATSDAGAPSSSAPCQSCTSRSTSLFGSG